MAAHEDHIPANLRPKAPRRIDERTFASLSNLEDGSPREVAARLEQLDREWDTDRVVETEAAANGLLGLALGALFYPRLLLLPAMVSAAVLLHARTGRYPLMPLFRLLGIRTAREIARERYALKGLRGDFDAPSADVLRAGDAAAVTGSAARADANGAYAGRLPPTARRVERNTSAEINEAIRDRTDDNIERFARAPVEEIEHRLAELDDESDIERVLQTNAAIVSLLGVALGSRVDRRFLALPAAVFGFFAQHALQGWCPPVPVFRRLGVRTTREIERERYALKVLRGDFEALPATGRRNSSERVRAVLAAVDA